MGLRILDTNRLWVDGLVPYEIEDGDFPTGSSERAVILDGINLVNECTNATFVPRDGETTFVRFAAATESCSTNVGMSQGPNTISCDVSPGEFEAGNVAHEMCHELGFHHEHVREDRDSFVTVHWDKIRENGCRQYKRRVTPQPADHADCLETFDPATDTLLTEDVGAYDYDSIMHYGEDFFRKDGVTGNTLSPTNPSTASIGNRDALSDGDISALNDTYGTAAIYVRDNLGDTGEEPLGGGGISRSPDIIHVTDEPADPQAEFGTAAAMGSETLSADVEFGQTNFVYVRLQKNGTLTDTAQVDLYWTLPSTLPSPTSWNKIGDTIEEANVAPGDVRVVGPFLFNDVPEEGHYCFVAVVDSRKNPAPDLDAINSRGDFENLVRKKSNLAWKNFDVVNVEEGGDMEMDFYVQSMKGASDDNALEFDLAGLPAGVGSEIRVLKRLVDGGSTQKLTLIEESKLYQRFEAAGALDVHGFADMHFESRESAVVRLKLSFPEGTQHGAFDISVRQLQGGEELGRITRRVTVGRFPFIGNVRTRELHRANCPWIPKMSGKNKRPFTKMELGLQRGYDGCHTCLLEQDTG